MIEIIQSFKSSFDVDLVGDLITDISDSAFDAFIDSDALNGIPVLGFLNSGRKIGSSIKKYFFAKKLYKFIYHTSDLSVDQKAEFMTDLRECNKENAYETLLGIIDRIDNSNKIVILTNLIGNKVWDKIKIEDFVRLSIVLERIPYPDLNNISHYVEDCYEPGVTDILNAAGILYGSVIATNETSKYRLNSIGDMFLKFGLNQPVELQASHPTDVKSYGVWAKFE